MSATRGASLVVLLGLLLGFGCQARAGGVSPPAPGAFVSIARGSHSGIVTPQELVIDSPGNWHAFWARHAPGTPAPPVDFATDVVVALLAGRRPTAGYRVEVLALERRPAATTVAYRVGAPPPGALVAQVLTSPFHIVRMPRPATPIRFEQR